MNVSPADSQDTTLGRFWSKVNKNGPVPKHRPELGACWVWAASRDRKGYGHLWAGNGQYALAHRFSWVLAFGEIVTEECVLHRCDNPPCCRPDHLFLGDRPANNADMIDKGRYQHGAAHYRAILTMDAAKEIRRRYQRGIYGYIRLGKEFGVSMSTVRSVIAGKSWREDARV